MSDFTLPPGVEVPELKGVRRCLYYSGPGCPGECPTDAGPDECDTCHDTTAILALCRVIREQDRMLRTEVAAHCVNGERSPDGVDWCLYCKGRLDALRRRVREEGEDG
jgi:hypothetical protein